MSLDGPISEKHQYKAAKEFNASIEKGEVTVKHEHDPMPAGETADGPDGDVPF